MKKFILFIIAAFSVLSMNAQVIDLGAMELDKEYALQDFKGYKGAFTAPKSGVLTCSSTNTDDMTAYSDANCTKTCSVTKNGMYGPHSYDMTVVKGTTYYFYISFVMNACTFKLTMADNLELTLDNASPALNTAYSVSGDGQVSFDFNKAVAFSSASIKIGNTAVQKLSGQVSNNGIFFNDVKAKVWSCMSTGTAKEGDDITISIAGVCMASNKTILYNGDGNFEAHYKVSKMPTVLANSTNTTGYFLSYYRIGDDAGLVKLNFSNPISLDKANVQIKYGEIDKEADGDYYVEYLTPTLSEDKKTLIVNLQGKRRKASDMVASGTTYPTVALGVTGVMDSEGNYTYAGGQGSIGSYWFSYTYQEVTAQVSADFTPASGSDITSKTKSFEIWISDENKLSYDGILFTYEKEGKADSVLVDNAQITKEVDSESANAKILTFSVPAVLVGAQNIELSFRNLQCADGSDYSKSLRARYNAFVISRAYPVAGATLEMLDKNKEVRIWTNKTSAASSLEVTLTDLNPGETDRTELFSATAVKSADGKYFTFSVPEVYRLEKGHEYKLSATAAGIGTDYILYQGAASVFRYSDMLLESVSPDTLTTTLSPENDTEITLSYDGLVKVIIDGIAATPVNPSEEGFANVWKYTITKEAVAEAGATLSLVVLATDMNDNRVQGNLGYKDYNVQTLTYKTSNASAIESVLTEDGSYIRYNLSGQRALPAQGLQITRNKVIFSK